MVRGLSPNRSTSGSVPAVPASAGETRPNRLVTVSCAKCSGLRPSSMARTRNLRDRSRRVRARMASNVAITPSPLFATAWKAVCGLDLRPRSMTPTSVTRGRSRLLYCSAKGIAVGSMPWSMRCVFISL